MPRRFKDYTVTPTGVVYCKDQNGIIYGAESTTMSGAVEESLVNQQIKIHLQDGIIENIVGIPAGCNVVVYDEDTRVLDDGDRIRKHTWGYFGYQTTEVVTEVDLFVPGSSPEVSYPTQPEE